MFGSEFLKLGEMIVFCAVITTVGGGVGFLLAFMVDVNSTVGRALIPFLRIGQWAPFFVVSALPKWPIHIISLELLNGSAAVSAFLLYELLVSRRSAERATMTEVPDVARRAILRALLFALNVGSFQSSGWMAELSYKPESTYGLLVLMCLFLFLFERAFRTSFAASAKQEGDSLVRFLQTFKASQAVLAIIFGLLLLIIWQIFADFGRRNLMLGSPVEVAVAGLSMFLHGAGGDVVLLGRSWGVADAVISLVEITVGVIMAGGLQYIRVPYDEELRGFSRTHGSTVNYYLPSASDWRPWS